MFGKIAKTIIAVELAAMAVIGGWVYSEVRYHQGREDAAKEIAVEAKFRELAKETLEKKWIREGGGLTGPLSFYIYRTQVTKKYANLISEKIPGWEFRKNILERR